LVEKIRDSAPADATKATIGSSGVIEERREQRHSLAARGLSCSFMAR
jgi:hypothetical protein